ncbi:MULTISPECIES: peptidoglycan DD-metalloendopeptidase family protein [Thermoanaerobacterium]|uniref:Peptidase M23 n=2 Tax=Thermoanaerobacterium TaxID=28895 RepID=W9EBF2_9THEO|nr:MULTISPECIES: M23 family metallopeptidase [Thermoanaerobacterium]AFK85475.1 Peptidase M23 [Thermoanaerobacterium saccharolyticum JW/SL-YS485]ETO39433.1 peptidase M23 [Thermoanaerobacterium aotearoense SCUT27]
MDNEDKSNPFSCNLIKKVSIKRRFILTVILTILFAVVSYIGIDKSAFSNMEGYSLNHFAYGVEQGRFDGYLKNLSDKNLRIDRPTAIVIDGLNAVTLKNREDASLVLNDILDKYKNGFMKVYFKNDVKLVGVDSPAVKIETVEEALKNLEGDDAETYTVKDHDTLWSISRKFGITLDDIYKLNPTVTATIFKGQILKVKEPKPVLTVVSEKKVVYMDDIPHETVYQKDGDMLINTSKVVADGEDGVKIVTAVLKYCNGQISEEDVINEDVLKEPVSEIVSVGTKPISATVALDYPIRGHIVITSRYGQRWGRLHAGIDIAASINDPIYAADGGTVVFAGWENGYGNLVEIDHGNGYVTYYGHANKLLVKKGDKVYKGEKIALVGMTGNTTGPHVHFEVRKNGVPVNPMTYLK